MPSQRFHQFGDLYIHFDVKFPDSLLRPKDGDPTQLEMPKEYIKKLSEVLPSEYQTPKIDPDAMTEDFELEDVGVNQEEARAAQGATAADEDDEMGGGERVQCASQ